MPLSDTETHAADNLTYRKAGVDVAAQDRFVHGITDVCKTTHRAGCVDGIGGFAALFDPKAAGFADGLLVAATDGVGTKLRLAIDAGIYDGLGQDVVAMCVNDLATRGAQPLFFLDYLATARLDDRIAKIVIAGVADACHHTGCALIGGETAEMPGMYFEKDFDIAGFAVGAVERDSVLPKCAHIAAGDVVVGIASNGIHSNGFSLVRHILDTHACDLMQPAPFGNETNNTLAGALLAPTALYVAPMRQLAQKKLVRALAHITGGGIAGNVQRVLPRTVDACIDVGAWIWPEVFHWLANTGPVSHDEMLATFNCGIGAVAICAKTDCAAVCAAIGETGFPATVIGEIVPGSGHVRLTGTVPL